MKPRVAACDGAGGLLPPAFLGAGVGFADPAFGPAGGIGAADEDGGAGDGDGDGAEVWISFLSSLFFIRMTGGLAGACDEDSTDLLALPSPFASVFASPFPSPFGLAPSSPATAPRFRALFLLEDDAV